jgi:hypothetical protein
MSRQLELPLEAESPNISAHSRRFGRGFDVRPILDSMEPIRSITLPEPLSPADQSLLEHFRENGRNPHGIPNENTPEYRLVSTPDGSLDVELPPIPLDLVELARVALNMPSLSPRSRRYAEEILASKNPAPDPNRNDW